MYLSRAEINPERRGARKLLASPQAMHAAILRSFSGLGTRPSGDQSSDGRVLWRIDRDANAVLLYLASPVEPDLTHIIEQAGRPATQTWITRSYTGLLDSIAEGQRWAFRLTANPVRSGRRGNDPETRRYGHVTVRQQRQWLIDRSERAGFRIPIGVQKEPQLVVKDRQVRRFSRDGRMVTLAIATFDGLLEVTNPHALRSAMCRGIGSGKAYGCGLLTLARLEI